MSAAPRVRAELVTIGSELLLGEIVDTNAAYLARGLRELGAEVARKTTVGDAEADIAAAVRAAAERADVVITTGGIGPTVDDPTRRAVARAAGVDVEFRPELWADIEAVYHRFGRAPTLNNRAQAEVPVGATAIANPVGTAPAFHLDLAGALVVALPGVPREMTYLFETAAVPLLRARFPGLGHTLVRVLHCAGAGESQIDAAIGDLESLTAPAVGLAAHAGVVDVRITGHGATAAEAEALVAPVEAEVRRRLGAWVYGADDETLEAVIGARLAARGDVLLAVEAGMAGELAARLSGMGGAFAGALVVPGALDRAGLAAALDAAADGAWPGIADGDGGGGGARRPTLALGASLVRGIAGAEGDASASRIELALRHGGRIERLALTFGGHPDLAARRAAFGALDLLRRRA